MYRRTMDNRAPSEAIVALVFKLVTPISAAHRVADEQRVDQKSGAIRKCGEVGFGGNY